MYWQIQKVSGPHLVFADTNGVCELFSRFNIQHYSGPQLRTPKKRFGTVNRNSDPATSTAGFSGKKSVASYRLELALPTPSLIGQELAFVLLDEHEACIFQPISEAAQIKMC